MRLLRERLRRPREAQDNQDTWVQTDTSEAFNSPSNANHRQPRDKLRRL